MSKLFGLRSCRRKQHRASAYQQGCLPLKTGDPATHSMKYPVAMAKLQTFEAHGHPRLDVCCLEYQTPVLDDCLEIRVKILEDQIEVGLVRENVQ